MNYLRVGIVFVICFIILYLIYYFFIITKCKKNNKYVPAEVNLILMRYKIDIKKIDLYKMIKMVSFITVMILSIVITFILEISSNVVFSIFFATIISIFIALISYEFVGRYYKNKSLKK